MRRLTAALLAPLAVTAALAGCSSSPSSATGSTNQSVKVTGTVGKAPTVHIPAQSADSGLVTKTVVQGHGPKVGGRVGQLDDRQVRGGVGAHDCRAIGALVVQGHRDRGARPAGRHDVVVGQDVARRVEDDPRALPAALTAVYRDGHDAG